MLFSHHTADSPAIKRSKGSKFGRLVFIIIILSSIAYGVNILYRQKDRILFKFKEDSYKELENKLSAIEKNKIRYDTPEVKEFLDLLKALLKDTNEDGYLHYMQGRLYFSIFSDPIEGNEFLFRNFIFSGYLEKGNFMPQLKKNFWQESILSYRKAILLSIPQEMIETAEKNLGYLYFWGGKSFSRSGYKYAEKNRFDKVYDLYNILLVENVPNWENLKNYFSEDNIRLFESVYYLKTGNTPLAFTRINKLSISEDIELRNMANYLAGSFMGKQNKKKTQFAYYSKINLETFLLNNKWFLAEYNFLLRFLGYDRLAAEVLNKYEKMTLEKTIF
ncbi:MAG: hypothetical protein OEZ13_11850 [Spirochaetia bacterium]|nr:hypothetical protein [Spirochaetia bacterium]